VANNILDDIITWTRRRIVSHWSKSKGKQQNQGIGFLVDGMDVNGVAPAAATTTAAEPAIGNYS
jgi:hypothetical protein